MGIKPNAFTIAEQWAAFERLVVPKGAHATQVTEMRRSFYAGFEAALRVQWGIGDASISETAGVAILEGLHEEAKLFAKRVARGEA